MSSEEKEQFYDRIFLLLSLWIKGNNSRPYFLGINGPQGCGKSTLSTELSARLKKTGLLAIAISIDDFYLTHQEQNLLAQQNPTNPYLQQRGYPGTHDIELGAKILSQLSRRQMPIKLPRYDKSAYQGRGDRFPETAWEDCPQPPDVVILEGWMLGFSPAEYPADKSIAKINESLPAYNQWLKYLDGFIHLVASDLNNIVGWRIEAEENMKAQGKSGMSTEQAKAYIELFMPAYSIYVPQLLKRPPAVKQKKVIYLQADRLEH